MVQPLRPPHLLVSSRLSVLSTSSFLPLPILLSAGGSLHWARSYSSFFSRHCSACAVLGGHALGFCVASRDNCCCKQTLQKKIWIENLNLTLGVDKSWKRKLEATTFSHKSSDGTRTSSHEYMAACADITQALEVSVSLLLWSNLSRDVETMSYLYKLWQVFNFFYYKKNPLFAKLRLHQSEILDVCGDCLLLFIISSLSRRLV